MLGYRGHFSTESRHYSTMLGRYVRRGSIIWLSALGNEVCDPEPLRLVHIRFAGQFCTYVIRATRKRGLSG
ncbi:hypothetical protein [Microbispora hainanensis]|uniref:hypothetical protein n=1 Tax=Microbispora hainanensis TaxID=568844 RepID=UPI003F542344